MRIDKLKIGLRVSPEANSRTLKREEEMKIGTRRALLAFVAATLGGQVAMAKVAVIQSPSAALAKGKSFAWAPKSTALLSRDPRLNNEIVAEHLRLAIESSLIARGYRLAPVPADADLMVSYQVTLQDKTDIRLNSNGIVCRPRLGCTAPGYDLSQSDYTQGTLVLDLRERSTGRLVWRATNDKKLKSKDASQDRLNKELMAMTKSLPPA
jgi:hypothetical protein